MGEGFARLMYGRYGNDALNTFLLWVSIFFLILSYIPPLRFFLLVAIVLMTYSNFRCLSRNLGKRRRELTFYLNLRNSIKSRFALSRKRWRERKTHCYFKCKSCKALLRVPKNKGKIDVTCPCCKTVTVKKT